MRPLFWLSTIAQESQQSASRGRVFAFYSIAPCLSLHIRYKMGGGSEEMGRGKKTEREGREEGVGETGGGG